MSYAQLVDKLAAIGMNERTKHSKQAQPGDVHCGVLSAMPFGDWGTGTEDLAGQPIIIGIVIEHRMNSRNPVCHRLTR